MGDHGTRLFVPADAAEFQFYVAPTVHPSWPMARL
jgi:hypothetical protein